VAAARPSYRPVTYYHSTYSQFRNRRCRALLLALALAAPCGMKIALLALAAARTDVLDHRNNRLPKLVPPTGTAWRGSELGGIGGTAAAYSAKYKVPLHIWRTFDSNVTDEQVEYVKKGGIVWFNFPVKTMGTWRQGATCDRIRELSTLTLL
jgi:hypothetical protein